MVKALDFGNLTNKEVPSGSASFTNSWFFSGSDGSSTVYNSIDYITIATLGNAQDFGDVNCKQNEQDFQSNYTCSIFAGGKIRSLQLVRLLII